MIFFKRFFHPAIFLLFSSLYSEEEARKRVCLNMIVKNEAAVIEKCLESVKPLIDSWCIVDTGSTDATCELIEKTMEGIPGELHLRPWVDFQHNRNEALELARGKADYLFFIDADEQLVFEDSFSLPPLCGEGGYYLTVRQIGAVDFLRCCLINAALPWKWKGLLHESLECDSPTTLGVLQGVVNLCNANKGVSGRSLDPAKYAKDAAVLERALEEDPTNTRYVYYLAQSYAAAENFELAVKNYMKRAEMPSKDYQETFFSLYYTGKILEKLDRLDEALSWLFKAHAFLPTRAEPLFRAAIVYRKQGNPFLGYLLTKYALGMPRPQDTCIEYLVYEYELLIEYANCALLIGHWEEGLDACNKLLEKIAVPEDNIPHILANRKLALEQLAFLRNLKTTQ
ncbi:MAG: glycosyltransferase family 2 protein [Verrucomicrobiota bacterium]|nr:glycosyltransferase family 2 protein [Verrucomicrobiota bacterium]